MTGSGTRDGLKPTAGVIVAGRNCGDPKAVMELASLLSWPVLADPCSGCRSEGSSGQVPVVAAADSILRSSVVAERLRPEVIVKLGSPWASKVVNQWLDQSAEKGAPVLVVDPYWAWSDPQRVADVVVAEDASLWCSRMSEVLRSGRQLDDGKWPISAVVRAEPGWAELWNQMEMAAQTAIETGCLAGHDAKADAEADTEHGALVSSLVSPAVARIVTGGFRRPVCVMASSSMTIREIEWFGTCGPDTPTVRSNRGANGIDGVVSTAVGVAVSAGPTVAVVGDLAFLHDLTALIGWKEDGPPLTVLVLDNGGGAIFSFLPQFEHLELSDFEALFAAPQGHDLSAVTSSLGLRSTTVESRKELIDALGRSVESGGLNVIHMKPAGSKELVATHELLHEAVVTAVEEVASRASFWAKSAGGDTSAL